MIKFYHDVMSPQSRAVLVLLNLLRIDHNIEKVDLASSTEFYPHIFEMNPENTVPIIDDDGAILSDSHAINAYLVDKYAPNDTLYPKDPSQRVKVDHMLHLDTGMLYPMYRGDATTVFNQYMRKMLSGLGVEIVKENLKIYDIIENFLKRSTFIAGDEPTIADISIYTSLRQMDLYEPPDRNDHLRVVAYMKRCAKDIDFLKSINDEGIDVYTKFVEQIKFKRWAKGKAARAKAKQKAEAKKAKEAKKLKAKQEAEAKKAEEAEKSSKSNTTTT